jgi:hypothetical protein
MNVNLPYVTDLRASVERATDVLLALPETTITARRAPGAWSVKEIIGHLVDSAANNHQRFVRAQGQADLIFSGYEQDEWVRVQDYQDMPWGDLLTLWHAYNHHLARVMALVPDAVRLQRHTRHNLHEIGWRPIRADRPATLDDLMRDYVDHLRHHLTQIEALTSRPILRAPVSS